MDVERATDANPNPNPNPNSNHVAQLLEEGPRAAAQEEPRRAQVEVGRGHAAGQG